MVKEKSDKKLKGADLARHLYEEAFNMPRAPRSEAYKKGVRAELDFRICCVSYPELPYSAGTAEYDAFFVGADEGRFIWRKYMDGPEEEEA